MLTGSTSPANSASSKSTMYKNQLRCRACGFGPQPSPGGIKAADNGERLVPVFDLGIQPLANDFRKEEEDQAGYAPLKVLFCPRCSLAQLSVVVDPEVMYRNYSYVTSPSDTMRAHFDRLYEDLHISHARYVVEIGSNDGRMLGHWKSRKVGLSVMGIDPAGNLAKIACENGIPTYVGLFNQETAANITPNDPDVVIARHVFCHAHDWFAFISALETLGHKNTLYCIEVPYVLDLLNGVEFDTIYHEHLSYLSIKSMQCLLNETNLHIEHIERYPIHGGAIMIHLRRNESSAVVMQSVDDFAEGENVSVHSWTQFSIAATERICQLKQIVETLRGEGKTVAAFGASAKSTVWINACKFTRRDISFICDSTPQKMWRLSPGSDIPIVDEGALLREAPDYVILFAWNFVTEVLRKHVDFTNRGGKFIVPVPTLRLLPS